MSHLNPGLISAYNSLTDKHLTGYFSNTRIRRHLQRAGLITRSGRIVPDKEYRHKLIQRAHQRHVRECLAQAIFHKVLEMERLHQIEIKKKLEEFARRERVHKIKLERSRRYEEDIIRILSPRPPTGARGIRKQHSGPEGEHSESSESLGSSRPNTAPGKMQRPVRLKPIHSNSTTASLRRSSPYRHLESSNDSNQPFNCTMDKESRRRFTTVEASSGISPYCLPVINNFVTPVPPAIKRKDTGLKVTPSSTLRGRRLRPTTASSGADVNEEPLVLRSSVHQSRVGVNMVYFGKAVHLSHDLTDMRDEVKVFQQHCGGENLCVFKGKLHEGESFQFLSRRHRGFPFSLTFFLNGLQVERLSSCCEFKHRKGSRLGGRHGHFGFSSVEGASPCYKCIIAMGLDKKPTPPPKRVREDRPREESFSSSKDAPEMETEKTGEDAAHPDFKRNLQQDMETQVKDETAEEDKVRDDYEEDFEADDEGPAGEAKEKTSPSPIPETETQVKERDASEPEDDEKEEDTDSRSGSSCSGSSQEASDAEATKDSREDKKAEQPEELEQDETVTPPEERKQPNPEEGAATETEPAVAKDSDLQDSAGDSPEMDIPDSSVPLGSEIKQSDNTSVEKEAEKTVDEGKQEESQEQERAKSVQEKLAEAILTASHRISEPDLRNPSTEEEEATGKGQEQSNNDLLAEKLVTFTEVQQTLREETKSVDVGEAEMVQDHEATSEPKEEGKETEKEAQESSDSTKDEKVEMAEDGGISAKEEETAEKDHSEETEENKTSEPQEDAAGQYMDADVAGKDEEHEGEKDAEVEEVQPDETGQGAKSRGEDESSASEPNKKADETAALDNAEMEVKTEPSEEHKALVCEEAPASNSEERQPADTKDTMNISETEVTAEDSSSSVEKTADISEDIKDDIKEEDAEMSKDSNKQERLGEEQTEKSVEKDEEIKKEKCEEEEKQTNPDENRVEKEENETDKTEKSESLTEEKIKNDEIIIEDTKTDSNTNEEVAKKTLNGEDKETNVERTDECETTNKDEESECLERKNDEGESEAKGTMPDETNEGEEIKEAKTDADGEKDEAEKEEKDDDGNKLKQSQSKKIEDERESEEKENVTCETKEGEISVITEEPERNVNYVRIPDENIAESEDVGDGEAAEEIQNKVLESEDVKKETGGALEGSEKAEIDAENGEISTRGERKSHEDDTEASSEDKNYLKAAEVDEDNRETEEKQTEEETTEVKEITVDCGDERADQGPDTDTADHDDNIEKQAEFAQKDSEQETSGTEIKEESKPDVLNAAGENHEEINDENGNKFDFDNESRDKDSTRNDDNNANEAIAAASATQPRPSTPTDLCFDGTTNATQLRDQFIAISDKQSHSDENAVVVDLPAADAENGADTEEATKDSEEGASVLLKPQAQNAEESITTDKDPPEALTADVSTDLVTNWVTMHQASKFFETFVEPLEELTEKASHAQVPASSEEEAKSTEQPRLKVAKASENEGEGREDETKVENNVGAVELDPESKQAEGGERRENDPIKDTLQEGEEETEVQDFTLKTEDNDKESEDQQRKGSRGSSQEDIDGQALKNEMSKTEVENVAGPHVASINPGGVEKQTGEEITDNHSDWNEKQTATEAMKDLRPSSKKEEHHEISAGPDGTRDTEEAQGKREVTEITDFTASSSEDGSQEGSHDGDGQSKPSDQGINGERRDVELIQDLKHTLSKDRLSTFSVDETLFGHSSYPLLTAAKTESGH